MFWSFLMYEGYSLSSNSSTYMIIIMTALL
jgi:hypothetical protein